jgi:hypothetical protein
MSAPCIHGFPNDQCSACRTCPHGLTASRCGRCVAAATAPARRRLVGSDEEHPSEEHEGFEIFYVPEVSGWQYRAPDTGPSPLSYRSLFLARKAVDEISARSKAAAASKSSS